MSDSKKKRKSASQVSSDLEPDEDGLLQWEDVKKARNRINSQRTREREKKQMESWEIEKTRLTLSNDALRFQNSYFRESIQQITEVIRLRRSRVTVASDNSSTSGPAIDAALHATSPPPIHVPSLPIVDVDLMTGATGKGRILKNPSTISVEQNATYHAAAAVVDPLRFAEMGRYPSAGLPSGLRGTTFEDLHIRRQAALEMEAVMLQRHRSGGMGNFQSQISMTQPSHSDIMRTHRTGVLPPLDVMEMRARRFRLQDLEMAGMGGGASASDPMMRLHHGIPAPSSGHRADSVRERYENSKYQDIKQQQRRPRYSK
ncbi:bZIP basic region leucine zipper domain containing protein [Nitzschia inconspicua]|uniref:BZIP basic region leucine zipper domain containing protein n=1 Tax=Nitzschia inconspicua TaxID=303405 RepID=A0A9K3KRU3_9STRA|nr:bZIP basic region leucine zipper domain containing protein [Nitzschia inconspicua]